MSRQQRAIVIGGSVAGLCAARALSDHFREVVVLERDQLPPDGVHRRGTPQSRHPHFLLNAGRRAIESLYPGFAERLLDAGGLELNPARDAVLCESSGWAPRRRGSMTMLYSSRILLERVLRKMALETPGIRIQEGTHTAGLCFGAKNEMIVTGARCTPDDDRATEQTLDADFVVDAAGRGSQCARWLEDQGLARVPVLTLDAKVMYSSRWYNPPQGADRPREWWWEHLTVLPDPSPKASPEHQYLCTIFPIENGKWIAFMGSWGLDMPKTAGEFEEHAARVRTPVFSRMLERAAPLSDVFVTRSTNNVWRRYDRLIRPAARFVALGDAVCAFNPLYGQGMSAAAVSATILLRCLRETDPGNPEFAASFFQRQAAFLETPWSVAVARDGAYAEATGTEALPDGWQKTIAHRLIWPVFNLISAAAREDALIEENFSRVFNIEQPMTRMLKNPRVLAGLALYQLKRWTKTTRLPSPADALSTPPATDYSRVHET